MTHAKKTHAKYCKVAIHHGLVRHARRREAPLHSPTALHAWSTAQKSSSHLEQGCSGKIPSPAAITVTRTETTSNTSRLIVVDKTIQQQLIMSNLRNKKRAVEQCRLDSFPPTKPSLDTGTGLGCTKSGIPKWHSERVLTIVTHHRLNLLSPICRS